MTQCDGCDIWFHDACVGLPEGHDAESDFFCPSCAARPGLFAKHLTTLSNLSSTVEAVQRDIIELKTRETRHAGNIERLTTRVDKHDTALQGIESDIRFMSDKSQALTIDIEERRRRERNLILRNIPEGSDERAVILDIARYLGVEAKIVRVERLGPTEFAGRIRPTRVAFEHAFSADGLLSAAPKLKNSPWSKTFINRDLTKLEQSDLEKELFERFERGENVTIVGTRVRPWRGDQQNPRQTQYFEKLEAKRAEGNNRGRPQLVDSSQTSEHQHTLQQPTVHREGLSIPPGSLKDPIDFCRAQNQPNTQQSLGAHALSPSVPSRPHRSSNLHPNMPSIHSQNRGIQQANNKMRNDTPVPPRTSTTRNDTDTPAPPVMKPIRRGSSNPNNKTGFSSHSLRTQVSHMDPTSFTDLVQSLSPNDISQLTKAIISSQRMEPPTQQLTTTTSNKPPKGPSRGQCTPRNKHKVSPPSRESAKKRSVDPTTAMNTDDNPSTSDDSGDDLSRNDNTVADAFREQQH